MLTLILASGYALFVRVRRLATRESAALAALAAICALLAGRGVWAGVRVLDAATAHVADRADMLRLAVAATLFVSVIGVAALLGARLSVGLPLRRYLHFPYRFATLYRCHVLWSLVGWWLLAIPLFQWIVAGLDPPPAPHGFFLSVRWLAVLLFVLGTNVTADSLGWFLELRFHLAWRWVLAAALGVIVVAGQPWSGAWAVPVVRRLLSWTPPGHLAGALGATTGAEMLWPLAGLAAYSALAVFVGARLAERVHRDPVSAPWRSVSAGAETWFERLWQRITALGVPAALGALVAREALAFVRIRRLRLLSAVTVIFVCAYAVRANHMSPLMLATLLCFPLAVMTAVFSNAFAFDRGGALGYLSLPVPARRVFLAKNIVFGAVTAILTSAGAAPVAMVLGARLSPLVVSFVVFFWYLVFGFLAIGNLISVLFPKAVDPQSVFGWLNPVASLPLSLAAGALVVAVPSIVFFRGREIDFVVFMSAALLLAVTAWLSSLRAAAALLRRRGVILE